MYKSATRCWRFVRWHSIVLGTRARGHESGNERGFRLQPLRPLRQPCSAARRRRLRRRCFWSRMGKEISVGCGPALRHTMTKFCHALMLRDTPQPRARVVTLTPVAIKDGQPVARINCIKSWLWDIIVVVYGWAVPRGITDLCRAVLIRWDYNHGAVTSSLP